MVDPAEPGARVVLLAVKAVQVLTGCNASMPTYLRLNIPLLSGFQILSSIDPDDIIIIGVSVY